MLCPFLHQESTEYCPKWKGFIKYQKLDQFDITSHTPNTESDFRILHISLAERVVETKHQQW